MKKHIAILGISTTLACGTLFAMNYPNKWNDPKTELNENTEEDLCIDCYKKETRKNWGHDEIQVTNNCSYAISISYKYWGTDDWVPVEFDLAAGKQSIWWPADNYKDFDVKLTDE